MRTLHYQFAGNNACKGTRFESAVRQYEKKNQDYLATLPALDHLEDEDLDKIGQGVLEEGVYTGNESVWMDIPDIIWNVEEH